MVRESFLEPGNHVTGDGLPYGNFPRNLLVVKNKRQTPQPQSNTEVPGKMTCLLVGKGVLCTLLPLFLTALRTLANHEREQQTTLAGFHVQSGKGLSLSHPGYPLAHPTFRIYTPGFTAKGEIAIFNLEIN